MFRRWVPASFIAVAIALALAGGAVLAVGGGDDDRRSAVFERAADVLGLTPAELEDAHDQATTEIRDEQLAAAVERFVAIGLLDQDEADSFITWMTDRPDSADKTFPAILTVPTFATQIMPTAKAELRKLGLQPDSDVIARMAAILGIDEQELADALEAGATTANPEGRLAMMHSAIGDLLESGAITSDEAAELNAWIDEIPEWLLDADLALRVLPALQGMSSLSLEMPGMFGLPTMPFGRGHFGDGELGSEFDFDFKLELDGPNGTFRFGPGDFGMGENRFPFDDEQLQELFEQFNSKSFGELEGLQGLLERFQQHGEGGMFEFPRIEPEDSTPESEDSDTSA